MSHASTMLTRFVTLYGPPKTDSVQEFLGEYERALQHFPRDILISATDHLLKRHGFANWPTVAECFAACEQEMALRNRLSRAPAYRPEPVYREPTEEEKAHARALVAAFKRQVAEGELERPRPKFAATTREAMEKLQAESAKTRDGMSRHGAKPRAA